MKIKDYRDAQNYYAKDDRGDSTGAFKNFVRESRSMDSEPRNMFDEGGLTMDSVRVLQDKQNFRDAWKNYKRSTRGSRPLSPGQFFKIWSTENMAQGGSAGQLVRNTVDGSRPGYNGAEIYKSNKGYGPELSTEKNVKKGFIYPKKNKLGKVIWSKNPGGTKRPIRYDFTKEVPIPEMDTPRFKFDIDKNKWVYLSRAEDSSMAKPTSHVKSIVNKTDNETFKQFIKRIIARGDEGSLVGAKKRIDIMADARNKVDDWTTKWLDENLDKYGIRDNKKFSNDLKKDYKKFVDKTFKTKKVSGTNLFSLDNLPNVSRSITEKLKPYEYEGIKTVNVGKYGGATQRLSQVNKLGKQTKSTKNPVRIQNNLEYFKRIFFKNRVENIPDFLDDLKEYFNYITTDKRTVIGREPFKNFIPNKDVAYFLDSNKSGLNNIVKEDVMLSLGDEVKLSYDDYNRKVKSGLNWVRNAETIEKTLGPREMKRLTGYETIRRGLDAEQKIIKKIFDFKELPQDLKLGYAIDHGQGISFAARSGSKDMMRLAVTDLIGSTYKTNDALGRGIRGETSFERQRKTLANKIREGDKVENNLNKLNKLIKNTYGKKNVYSIKNGNLVSSQISPATTQEERFAQYFKQLDKTKEGSAAIKTQHGSLKNLLSSFWCNTKQIAKAGGGRIGFSGSCSVEVKQKNFLRMTNDVATGKVTGEAAEKIAQNAGKVVAKAGSKSALASIFGPTGILLDVAYEVGSIGVDMYANKKPFKEALQDNWITGAFIPGTSQEEFHKRLFKKDSGTKVYGEAKDLTVSYNNLAKKIERIKADTTYRGKARAEKELPGLERDLRGIEANYMALTRGGKAMEEGSPEYENYMAAVTELRDADKAKSAASAASLKMELDDPMSDRYKSTFTPTGEMKIDFSLPQNYTTFKPTLPTTEDLNKIWKDEGYKGTLPTDRAKEFITGEKWRQEFEQPGIRGTQDWRGATGGLAGLMKKYYD